MIRVQGVSKSFGPVRSLRGVTATFQAGRSYVVAGPNGCGKSTLLNLVAGFYRPDSGTVALDSGGGRRVLNRLPAWKRARMGIGLALQEPRAPRGFTVEQAIALWEMGPSSSSLLGQGARRFAATPAAGTGPALLKSVGIDADRGIRCDRLSYGQRKLLDLAGLLSRGVRVYLLDEPFAGVDPKNRAELIRLLALARRPDTVLIVVSHELERVAEFADEIVLMDEGRVLLSGPPADVIGSAEFRAAYLG